MLKELSLRALDLGSESRCHWRQAIHGLLTSLFLLLSPTAFASPHVLHSLMPQDGLRFLCDTPQQMEQLIAGMDRYLGDFSLGSRQIIRTIDYANHIASYVLNSERGDTNTLNLNERPEFGLSDEHIEMPGPNGKLRTIQTVSKKEIVLALLQRGRLTEFYDEACTVEALNEHVQLRQNVVAWAENLEWKWPNGGPAKWNRKYWPTGVPNPKVPLPVSFNDLFFSQRKYEIGCYTAAKAIMAQGMIDYYNRVLGDPDKTATITQRLMSDGDPLVDVEPGIMWDFEEDFDGLERVRPGKLLKIRYGVAADNFVPGDWSYFLNTDPVSYQHTGYEGSNAIYLGRNRFHDNYNDNNHAYTYSEKLDEVYQWRNGVFSRSRDAAKIQPLGEADMQRLARTPAEGGLLLDMRVFPYLVGFESLPALKQTP